MGTHVYEWQEPGKREEGIKARGLISRTRAQDPWRAGMKNEKEECLFGGTNGRKQNY